MNTENTENTEGTEGTESTERAGAFASALGKLESKWSCVPAEDPRIPALRELRKTLGHLVAMRDQRGAFSNGYVDLDSKIYRLTEQIEQYARQCFEK